MQVIHRISELRACIRAARAGREDFRVGFVPTMGFLHEGHASLLKAARKDCDLVVLSIFVNPLQFGPGEDFERYPRDEQRDLVTAAEAGADIVFMPQVEDMYPLPTRTIVSVAEVTSRLCGASRPGHFDGVATVVTKLLNIVQPDDAYFGMKDAQQVAVIEQMVLDLNMPVRIRPCPIVREADGLAKSSRNVYLNPEERRQAVVLSEALGEAGPLIEAAGDRLAPEEAAAQVRSKIEQAPLAVIDYVEVLDYPSLQPIHSFAGSKRVIVAVAVKFGHTRLIDNIVIPIQS
ncbi:pantoate--beta-alanine ligase [Paenibacillus sp. UNCCL117]|uniref:pantoate--beta-alanine ligase n=1 Tax=unclassified Paenibacillus TaxID=185978 RepID=UPI0008831E77|nr:MULTISPECIES: pantoate--beta-alanine ligase [unclassified Paenibacillus]SDC41860.1 pantoate--beta-alanine ligase [Paenibacillus sp. cl123]SFW13414.1 pantoate--beta-alanine ligase [Paenibacillus sp. UNCCL117]